MKRAAIDLYLRDHDCMVGFNDVCPWNSGETVFLFLRISEANRPPRRSEVAELVTLTTEGQLHIHDRLYGWNYPMGARQQWIGGSADRFLAVTWEDDLLVTRYYRLGQGTERSLPWPIAALSPDGRHAAAVDLVWNHHLGGYGAVAPPGVVRHEAFGDDLGLVLLDVDGDGTPMATLTRSRIAGCSGGDPSRPTLITHPLFNHDGRSIAFLERAWLPDGGAATALLVYDLKVDRLHHLGTGFLSHFAWCGNDRVMIFGTRGGVAARLRGSRWLGHPLARPLARLAKGAVRCGRRLLGRDGRSGHSFLLLDRQGRLVRRIESPTGDGHPSFFADSTDRFLCDSYPDRQRRKHLFLCRMEDGKRLELAVHPEPEPVPDLSFRAELFDCLHPAARRAFTPAHYHASRSGLSCDLHPKWDRTGQRICIECLHPDGRRGLAILEV